MTYIAFDFIFPKNWRELAPLIRIAKAEPVARGSQSPISPPFGIKSHLNRSDYECKARPFCEKSKPGWIAQTEIPTKSIGNKITETGMPIRIVGLNF
jgi:hypothetical protein